MTNYEKIYDELLELGSLGEYDNKTALLKLGLLDDASYFLKRIEGLELAILLSEELKSRDLSNAEKVELHYFIANIWSDIGKLKRTDKDEAWVWEQEELENEIINIRYSLKYLIHSKVDNIISNKRKCEILTNYGNILSSIGRIAESVEIRDLALEIDPHFSMAKGNKGSTFFYYSQHIYDIGHQAIFLNYAHKLLSEAICGNIFPHVEEYYKQIIEILNRNCPEDILTKSYDLTSFSFGDSEEEIKYRKWALKNRLFLNPLNDIGEFSIAARDVLSTPSITTDINTGPQFQGFFNQIKQEFVSARFLYYEGINQSEKHYSDNEVLLLDTKDYVKYGINIEKIKMAFRISYSIFDKIANFINYYFNIGINDRRVNFRTMWYSNFDKKEIRDVFYKKENLPLRALYWISKDFFNSNIKDSIELDSEEINKIRNYIEHRYVKVHEIEYHITKDLNTFPYGEDKLAYSVVIDDLEAKTLKLLKLARSAILYLSQAIFVEETHSHRNSEDRKLTLPINLNVYDNYKYQI